MTQAITTTNPTQALTLLGESVGEYVKASKASNTKRAYKSAWATFAGWAEAQGLATMPATPQTVSAYLAAMADSGSKVATIRLHRAAISFAHKAAGESDPTPSALVKATIAGIVRKLGSKPTKKAPVTPDTLRQLVLPLGNGLRDIRNRALVALGFAGAFRRSELAALDVADLRFDPDALRVTLKRSKTDQNGKGFTKVLPPAPWADLCPIATLKAWLDAAHITSGPIFRPISKGGEIGEGAIDGEVVADVVKELAGNAGLDAALFAGHSLRSGFVTAAAIANVDTRDIMALTGHKTVGVVLGYVQDAGVGAKRAVSAAYGGG